MVTTSRTQKALTAVAMALIVAVLAANIAGHMSHVPSAATRAGGTSAQQSSDIYSGGFHQARGTLLYRLEMQPHRRCINLHLAQRVPVVQLDTYVIDEVNGHFTGGKLVARLIALNLGSATAC